MFFLTHLVQFLCSISFTYGRYPNQQASPCHGGLDGQIDEVTLEDGEVITSVEGMSSSLIDKVAISGVHLHLLTHSLAMGHF